MSYVLSHFMGKFAQLIRREEIRQYFIVTFHDFTYQTINLVIDFVIKCYCKDLKRASIRIKISHFLSNSEMRASDSFSLFQIRPLSPPTEGRANFQTSGIAHSRGRRCPNSSTGLRKKSSWVNLEK